MDLTTSGIRAIARLGLTAKGIVYCLLGMLAFMAAFHINGTTSGSVDKKGVFSFVEHQYGGKILLGVLALGLLCYSIWRLISAFSQKNAEPDRKKWTKGVRYFFSGLVYLSLAVFAGKMTFEIGDSGSGKEDLLYGLFDQPFGHLITVLAALALAATGIYQGWYGLSEKYKKHVKKMDVPEKTGSMLLVSGKIGYVARGIVWLTLSWMLAKAALYENASQAGDTSKAFGFLQSGGYGPYLISALGLGLVCYGIFNFIRARFETFG